jgi:formyltetrahydrofolate-dependent phosphoribosylglycinamide formyltransferase
MSESNDRPARLGVLLSGGGRTMLNLLGCIERGELTAEIVTVIASRPCKGLDRARERGIPVHLVAYKDYGESRLAEYSAAIAALLDEAEVDIVCLAGFLSKWVVPERYAGRVLNIHPALLPDFGGKGMYGHRVHEAVLKEGRAESGCTVHLVTNEYDAGPILVQKHVPVEPGDDADRLSERVFQQECLAYPEAIKILADRIGLKS